MTEMRTTPTWPPVTLSENDVILDFIRQQERAKMERALQEKIEQEGLVGIRKRLDALLNDMHGIQDFPDPIKSLTQVAYDLLWEETRE